MSDDQEPLTDHTRRVWEPRAGCELSDHDCRQIERNIYGFLGVLAEWAKADQQHAETENATSPTDTDQSADNTNKGKSQ